STISVAAGTATGTILDDGTGPGPFGPNPAVGPDDDRPNITVTGRDNVSEGSNAVFTVDLSNASASATEITLSLGAPGDTALADDYSSTVTAYYYVGLVRNELPITAGKISLPAGVTSFFVSVATTNDTPKVLEGAEHFTLTAAITSGASGSDTATIVDDGSGKVYDDHGVIDPAGIPDDDRAEFVPLTPPPPAPPVAPPAPVAPAPTVAPYVPAPAFESSLLLTKPSTLPLPDRPAIGDILTSPQGYRVNVIEAPQSILRVYHGVTDQFVEAGRTTSFNLPSDAFAHTRPEAVLSVEVKLADGRPLPSWVVFNPQSGSFAVNAPRGHTERLVIRVTVRDNQGQEASAMFKLDVGNGKPQLPGRISLSDQLRVASQRSGPLLHLGRDPATERAAVAAVRGRA
ncbi:MAG: hypothetical protein B7Y51_10090, partial [Burkholderiales bacterium 28-67-8]